MDRRHLLLGLAVGYGAAALICAALSLDAGVIIELAGGLAGVICGGIVGTVAGRRAAVRLRRLAWLRDIPGFVPPRGWSLVRRLIR